MRIVTDCSCRFYGWAHIGLGATLQAHLTTVDRDMGPWVRFDGALLWLHVHLVLELPPEPSAANEDEDVE
jgi:hypothetical protein